MDTKSLYKQLLNTILKKALLEKKISFDEATSISSLFMAYFELPENTFIEKVNALIKENNAMNLYATQEFMYNEKTYQAIKELFMVVKTI